MKTIPFLPAGLVLGGVVFLCSGCGSSPESFLVKSPPPRDPTAPEVLVASAPPVPVVVAVPAAVVLPAGAVNYVVLQAPPAPQPPQAVPDRPSADHVWIVGYWTWRNARYEWMAGRWEMPPRSGAVWVNPTWTEERGAYRFFEGYWS